MQALANSLDEHKRLSAAKQAQELLLADHFKHLAIGEPRGGCSSTGTCTEPSSEEEKGEEEEEEECDHEEEVHSDLTQLLPPSLTPERRTSSPLSVSLTPPSSHSPEGGATGWLLSHRQASRKEPQGCVAVQSVCLLSPSMRPPSYSEAYIPTSPASIPPLLSGHDT